jgi:chloramphenicol 3-O-phosphotransferase
MSSTSHGPKSGRRGGSGDEDQVPDVPVLSVLDEALRRALGSVPREQVAKVIAAALPIEVVVDESARLHGGKVRKVSVSMPEELAEAVRARTGAGGFSRYVTEAVDREIRHDLLGELIDDLEATYGPVSQELLDEASREWPDHEDK